ncbi:protein NKG7 [Orycteropus afer afer]|uniref:Protein NKG7 n=1 Tax=Orycteropus afer afer TaxID=1230840 RepID=A0AC54Z7I0_ORYAF|nr:protein NKG7 [Orycteropus afer afer]
MEPHRTLALLAGSLGLVVTLTAMSTDWWVEVKGPHFSIHAGLWLKGPVAEYIHVTQAFTVLASLGALLSLIILGLTFMPLLSSPSRAPVEPSLSSLSPALFMTVAMVVYTSEHSNQDGLSQLQDSFGWSFYLGWVSCVLLLCTGSLSLSAYCARPSGYDTL